ncbi:MAG: SGNH/GDSL hydrolase family protein [Proteobacteria bacterium]|nr:SGNH/GDSL hydrolase family protein [Pseudomonadota bacterium]
MPETDRTGQARTRWSVVGALTGAALGLLVWWAVVGALPQVGADWDERPGRVPVETAALAGPLAERPGPLDLWFFRGVSPQGYMAGTGAIRVTATVPEGGQLRLQFGFEQEDVAALPPNAPPGDEPLQDPGLGRADLRRGSSLVLDRTDDGFHGGGLMSCESLGSARQDVDLLVRPTPMGLDVFEGEQLVARCVGPVQGSFIVSSGVRRIRVHALELDGWGGGPFASGVRSPWLAPLAMVLFALLGGWWVRDRRGLVWLPLLALDLRPALDAMRLLGVASTTAPLLLGLGASIHAALVAYGATTLRRQALQALGASLALAGVAALGSASVGWLALVGPVGGWAALAWVNRNPVGARVRWSYGLIALWLLAAESAVRISPLAAGWSRVDGWTRAHTEFVELIELQEHRDYPTEGFPVRPPPRGLGLRLVAFGGSATGGAFQNDDLSEFWPSRLANSLLGWEVVNQGVGGWNTLHIRLYAVSQMQALEPDIVVVYVGHNDLMTPSSVSYRDNSTRGTWTARGPRRLRSSEAVSSSASRARSWRSGVRLEWPSRSSTLARTWRRSSPPHRAWAPRCYSRPRAWTRILRR